MINEVIHIHEEDVIKCKKSLDILIKYLTNNAVVEPNNKDSLGTLKVNLEILDKRTKIILQYLKNKGI